jgi:hypothetical protein
MPITHGFAGFLQIDGVRVLCREGASLLHPRNLDIPYPISAQQGGQLNYGDMPTFPVIQVPAIPMDPLGGDAPTGGPGGKDADPWFTSLNLNNWFIIRTAGPAYDLNELGGPFVFSDNGIVGGAGLGTWQVNNAKAAGFSLNIDKGAPVGFVMRWAGGSIDSTIPAPSIPDPTMSSGLPGKPLQAGVCSLGGVLANKGVIGVTLDFDTGLSANMELDGTNDVKEQNADLPTAALTIRMNAQSGIDPPGFGLDGNGAPSYYEALNLIINIKRDKTANKTLSFTIPRAIPVDPDNRRQMRGRVVRSYRYNCLASLGAVPGSYPIIISEA